MYVRTWTFHVDTITFEGVSGSKQNLMSAFLIVRCLYLTPVISQFIKNKKIAVAGV